MRLLTLLLTGFLSIHCLTTRAQLYFPENLTAYTWLSDPLLNDSTIQQSEMFGLVKWALPVDSLKAQHTVLTFDGANMTILYYRPGHALDSVVAVYPYEVSETRHEITLTFDETTEQVYTVGIVSTGMLMGFQKKKEKRSKKKGKLGSSSDIQP